MNIQPPSSYPREINVVEPITPAYERVKQMLFKPFDLAKWITIGFCAWLAGLGESGGGGSYGYNGDSHGGNHASPPLEQFRHFYHEASDYVTANLVWIVPLAIFLVLAGVVLWVLLLWLSSRGKFMFLHCVALDKAEVEVPWRKFAGAANSLLRFRIVLWLIGMLLILPVLGLAAIVILRMALRGEADVAGVGTALVLVLAFVFLALGLTVIRKFMMDFVVPIMFLRGGTCLAAWREFCALLLANAGDFALYILFQIVLTMAIGIIVLLAILATCCIAGCLMLLPFLGTVLLLPVLVFKRAYSLYYLAQYGPLYDVFPIPPAPATLPAQPPVAG
jgi:hypothetical protein